MAAPEPEIATLKGNVKVTREDWLNLALDVLVSSGVDRIKVLTLSERLGVSRSSFYWYFKSRKDLLDALLELWRETNTKAVADAAQAPAETVTGAVCNLFRCFIDPTRFDPQLDFAVREWSRRSGPVRRVVDQSDEARVAAIATMFERYDYAPPDALIRARILYYMQIGYYALELRETLETRLANTARYLEGFTGRAPRQDEIDALAAYARAVAARD